MPEWRWTVLKIPPHAHPDTAGDTDTCRYLAAGAARARLVTTPEAVLDELAGGCVFIESNRVLEVLAPDLYLFVVNEAEPFKESARPSVACAESSRPATPHPP